MFHIKVVEENEIYVLYQVPLFGTIRLFEKMISFNLSCKYLHWTCMKQNQTHSAACGQADVCLCVTVG